jgi:hypothetical protein
MVQFVTLPQQGADQRQVAEVVRGIMDGKTNNTGTITLATGNATSTTLYNERIGYESVILLTPDSSASQNDSAPYGCFTNNTDQTAPSVGATAVVIYDTTEESNGVYRDTVNTSRIYVRNAGMYNVQFSLQLVNKDNAVQYADIWFRVNGVDVPRSASRFDIPIRKNATVWGHVIGTVNTFLDMAAGDYVEIAGTTSSTLVGLEHYSADTGIPRPAIPAVILTVQYISVDSISNVYISSQTRGSAVISHYANSTADKTYKYVIVG